MRIGENTLRSVASGNGRFAVAWMREIARTSERCEQSPEFLGNTEEHLKQTLHYRTEQTASNARACARGMHLPNTWQINWYSVRFDARACASDGLPLLRGKSPL